MSYYNARDHFQSCVDRIIDRSKKLEDDAEYREIRHFLKREKRNRPISYHNTKKLLSEQNEKFKKDHKYLTKVLDLFDSCEQEAATK